MGKRAAAKRESALRDGGTLSGRQARKLAKRGGIRYDGKIVDTKGKVIGDTRGGRSK